MVGVLKVEIHIYPRDVWARESININNSALRSLVEGFVSNVVGGARNVIVVAEVDMVKTSDATSSLHVTLGQYSDIFEVVVPAERALEKSNEFLKLGEILGKAREGFPDTTYILDWVKELWLVFEDLLLCEENTINTRLRIEDMIELGMAETWD